MPACGVVGCNLLKSVQENSSPPLNIAKLETEIESAVSSNDAKFRKAILATLKIALSSARQALASEFEINNDGAVYVGRHAWIMDLLVSFIVAQAGRRFGIDGKKHRMTVVAVGGYGRGELAPFSDIDILFVMSETRAPAIEKTIEFSLYLMWDLGLKVGYATRTVRETIDTAKADQTVLTGLLEMRKIAGHQQLYGQLESALAAIVTKTKTSGFVEQKLTERDQRHARLGATRYVVEPNIKEGKGGLRDLHTLFWITNSPIGQMMFWILSTRSFCGTVRHAGLQQRSVSLDCALPSPPVCQPC